MQGKKIWFFVSFLCRVEHLQRAFLSLNCIVIQMAPLLGQYIFLYQKDIVANSRVLNMRLFMRVTLLALFKSSG